MRSTNFWLVLIALSISSGCAIPGAPEFGAPGGTSPGEVHFELARPNDAAILVPVKINGQGPYTFVLDTGATFTCIDQKLANELKLPEWQGLGVGVIGPTGGNIRLVTLDTLEVGTVKASDLKACTIDFKQMNVAGLDARGLVGLNFLKSFHMSIDFKTKLLKLEKE